MPGTVFSAAATCAPEPALANTGTGWPEPAAKCLSTMDWPVTEPGVVPRNDSAVVKPLDFRPVRPIAIAPSTRAVTIQTVRGRRPIERPTRDQKPRAVGSAEPNFGLTGQKTQRPKITSSAGSRVIIATRATATPIARTGPRPFVE